jgi:hypothetical protein
MKYIIAIAALLSCTEASAAQKLPEHLGELFTNKENLYGSSWEKYKKTR